MRTKLKITEGIFPMPVLMVATYGDGDVVDVMNMAWGSICARNMVSLKINEKHKTSENLRKRGAFTLSIADLPHMEAADFSALPAVTGCRTSLHAAA